MRNLRDEVRFHPVVLAAVVLSFFFAFTIGYYQGSIASESEHTALLRVKKDDERHVSGLAEGCEEAYAALARNSTIPNQSTAIQSLASQNKEMENQIAEEGIMYDKLFASESSCRHEVNKLQAEDTGGSESVRQIVEEANEETEALRASLNRLTNGDWINGAIIDESLTTVGRTYRRLCGRLPRCTVSSNEMLLSRWNATMGRLPSLRWQVESQSSQHMLWKYDASNPVHKDVFLPEDDESKPTFFHREGNPPMFVGNAPEEPPVAASVAERLQVVYSFALCAFRRNNPNFTVLSSFYWRERKGNATNLHRLVQTPLVTFCRGCQVMETSYEFWLACQDASPMLAYGQHDYWAMRSMVRPQTHIVREARRFFDLHSLSDRTVLAVVARNSAQDCLKLSEEPRENYFLYLAANFPEESGRIGQRESKEALHQCSPTANQVAARITEVINEQQDLGRPSFDAIYLSSSVAFRDELRGVAVSSEWWDSVVYRRTSETDGAVQEFEDLVTASMASGILVSPYLAPSQYVLESFLLRHKLHPDRRVWFF